MDLPHDLQPLVEILAGRLELTPPEVAAAGGIDLELTRRLWRALGFPPVADDARVFSRRDAATLTVIRGLLDRGRADPALLAQLARVTGRSLARVADAQIEAAAALFGDALGELPPFVADLERLLVYVWRRHLLAALLRRAARPTVGEEQVTVGFADMVGFTALSQALDAHALAAMVDRFEGIVYEHIPKHGGRIIKMIGDEVMFAVDDVRAAAEIALSLAEAHAAAPDFPDVRVALANGPAVAWEGDLFGPTVNLASRLVAMARPRTVLVSDALGAELEGAPALAVRHLRAMPLQGIGRVRSWVLRRADVAPPPAPSKRGRRRAAT